jgi:hypothetical protein
MAASQRRLKAQGQLCLNSWFPISYLTTDCIELTSVDVSAKSVQMFTIINCYVLFCLLFKDCCVLLYLLFKVFRDQCNLWSRSHGTTNFFLSFVICLACVVQCLPELAEVSSVYSECRSSSMITFLSKMKAIPFEVLRFWPSYRVLQVVSGSVQVQESRPS